MARSVQKPPGARLDRVSPELLEFDPENPRLGGGAKGKSQDQIATLLLEEPHLASQLVDSIVENGFIDYEPLVVRKSGSKYIVIEGNRRLAAVKYLRANLDKYPNRKEDVDKIPVLIFTTRQTTTEKQHVRAYLGVRHLLGIREWPPLSKAQFLERESKAVGSLDAVLKEVRLGKTQARRFLIPYRLLKKAGREIPPGDEFWVLAEALNRAGVKEYINLETDDALEVVKYSKPKLDDVLQDLYGPLAADGKKRITAKRKVAETRNLSTYGKVLSTPKALSALRGGKELAEAAIYVDTKAESISRLGKLVSQLEVLVKKIAPASPKGRALRDAVSDLAKAAKAFIAEDA